MSSSDTNPRAEVVAMLIALGATVRALDHVSKLQLFSFFTAEALLFLESILIQPRVAITIERLV